MTNGTLSFFASQLPQPPQVVGEKLDYTDYAVGGVWGVPSYFNATLTDTVGGLLNGKYDAWCLDPGVGIFPSRDYSVAVYSSYGSIPSSVLPAGQIDGNGDGYLTSLQAINWVFNYITEPINVIESSPGVKAYQYNIDSDLDIETFTFGDVQLAIWKLLNATITPGDLLSLGSYDSTLGGASDQIVDLARTLGHDFVPTAGQDIGVILSPVVDGVNPGAQPTIIEVKTAGIGDTVFFDKNNNGLAEADEGIKDVTVRLWADTNGDGSVDTHVASAVTGDNPNTVAVETGYYFFGPLLAGPNNSQGLPGPGIVYKVVVDTSTLPNGGVGWANTVDPDGPAVDGDSMSTETLTPGEVNLEQDFGYRALDYGDNPDSYGTTNAANGARHVLSVGQTAATPALYLGALVDAESDGFPSLGANGDNGNNLNDEDGIQFLTPIQAGQSTQIKVTVVEAAGVDGRLNAWIDFNGDGDFSDTGEQIFTDLAVVNGMQTLSFTAPTDAVLGETYARFRLSTDTGLTSTGLASNGEVEDYQVAVKPLGSIGDKVWLDCNNNGIQDAGEAGVAGVTVHLLKAGQEIETTITDDNGEYLFSNLGVGSYAIQVEKPVGYAFTSQDAGGNTNVSDAKDSDVNAMGLSASITLGTGDNNLTVDAGLVGDPVCVTYDFSGRSYTNGTDGNSRTYEMSGVSVTATAWSRQQDNGNWAKAYLGAYDGGLGVTDSSEGSGSYNRHTVDNRGGRDNYVVFQFSQDVIVDWAKLGYVVNDSDISVWIGSSGASVPITNVDSAFLNSMTSFENNWTSSGSPRWANFNSDEVSGNVLIIAASIADRTPDDEFKIEKLKICTAVNCEPQQANASIGDRVWLDSNGNGLQDGNEVGVEGVTVKLLNGLGDEVGSATTDGNGDYLFSNLTPGDYAIKVEKPADYSFTTKDVGSNGSDAKDSDVDTVTGKTDTTNLTAGENDLSWDAGLYKNPSIGDKVWLDCNNNGIQDTGEAGVAGVTVKLLGAGDVVVATTTTNASGEYVFSGLTAGSSYAVQVVAPTGFAFAKQDQGGDDTKDSDVNTSTGKTGTITLDPGENDISWDAGLVAKPICITYNFNGSSGTDGKDGNVRSYTESGVTVKASAWSREKGSTDKWAEAYLGAYSGGHGVTDSSEGSGGNNTHTVDNVGRDNFVVYQFSQEVVVDWAKLGYVVNDSDLSVWIGSYSDQIKIGNIKAALAQMSHYEEDWINNGQARTADFNAGEKSGNVLIIAANISDKTPEDRFKITELKVCTTANCAPNPLKASVGDKVWEDKNHNNIQDSDEPGIGGITVNLMDASGTNVLDTTTTTSNGNYKFSDLDPGKYVLQFDKADVVYRGYNMSNWKWAVKDAGSDDSKDSDVAGDGQAKTNVTKTDAFTLLAGQNDITRDAGITPIVIDLDGNGIQTVSRADSGGSFDLFGNGNAVQSGWIAGGEAFLAVDRNGNGQIDDISELFGGSAKGAGFAQLASYDSNGDGLVDAADSGFADLLIWRDANGNHQSDAGELMTLAEAGLASLNVSFSELPFLDRQGNLHLERSSATMSDGRVVDMTDVYFNVAADDAAAAGVALPELAHLLEEDWSLGGESALADMSDIYFGAAANDGAAVAEEPVTDPGWMFA